jgi:hypothetical protein
VPTTVAWRDLTLTTGGDQPYRITAVDGWEQLPEGRYDKLPRSRGHGSHPSPVWADERVVTVEGFTHDEPRRDELLHALQRSTTFGGTEEPLTVDLAGRTLTAAAQLLAARPALLRGEWGIGRFGWVLQWRCPDPVRYGPATSQTIGLPSPGAGLTYPLAYPLDYGEAGSTGQVTVTNPGTADAPLLLTAVGPLPGGFAVSAAGQEIRYPVPIPAGQTVTVDTGAGTVLVEGTASRRGDLTRADWIQVPPAGTVTLQFVSLGGYQPDATLTATIRPAYW